MSNDDVDESDQLPSSTTHNIGTGLRARIRTSIGDLRLSFRRTISRGAVNPSQENDRRNTRNMENEDKRRTVAQGATIGFFAGAGVGGGVGAAIGAAVGSIIPGPGTVTGAITGSIIGGIAAGVLDMGTCTRLCWGIFFVDY